MTNPMAPEEARKAIDATEGTTDYTWSEAHHALETIAGMKEEWATEGGWRRGEDITWHPVTDWYPSREQAESTTPALSPRTRLVRRYVTQVIEDE